MRHIALTILLATMVVAHASEESGATLSPRERAEALGSAAQDGSAAAQLALGHLYARGHGVDPDREQAAHWYRAAADSGVITAMRALGLHHLDREARPAERARGLEWLQRAAELADAESQYRLGMALMAGADTSVDDERAAEWLRQAADLGHPEASVAYAYALYAGRGVEPDFARAGIRVHQAVAQGHHEILDDLASRFRDAAMAPRDPAFAHFLFGVAARWQESERVRENHAALADELEAGDLERSRRLTDALETAAERKDPVVYWRVHFDRAEDAYRNKDYGQAETTIGKALSRVHEAFGEQHVNTARVLGLKARILEKTGETTAAGQLHLRALDMLEHLPVVPAGTELMILRQVARHYRNREQWEQAHEILERELTLAETRFGADSAEAASALSRMGLWRYFSGRPGEAIPYLEQVIRIAVANSAAQVSTRLNTGRMPRSSRRLRNAISPMPW